jgi:hypothetical protein
LSKSLGKTSNLIMKALRSPSLVAAVIMAAGGICYSGYTAAHVRDLERRLQRAEKRVANVERQMKPHVEMLPPYVPNN